MARAVSVSIINQFKLHDSFRLCLASVHLPYPSHLVFGFQFLGHAVSLRQLRHDQLHAVSCRFVNLSAILSYVHPAIGCFFVWRRERDSSGGTGAVPPPARGTKKTSTGRFFASLRSAVPFESLPLSLHKQKAPLLGTFLFGAEKGIRTLVTVPRKHDFQSCAFDQLSHLCKPLKYNTTFLCALQAESYIADKNSLHRQLI